MTWGLRILDRGEMGLKVPHEPGDYSFVAYFAGPRLSFSPFFLVRRA